MKVLITGADGFVGEHLVAELLSREVEVAASAVSLPPTRATLTPSQIASVDWKAADVRDLDALRRIIVAIRPDRIFHLAGFSSGALAREQADVAVHVNAGGTVNLCEAVLEVREEFSEFEPRILVMGSGDAYGDSAVHGGPLREDMPLRPVSPYGLSKACQELVAHTYRRARGLRTVVMRGFNLVGCGQQPAFVVPDFCTQVAEVAVGKRKPVLHVGNLDVERDFTDVRDGVAAFVKVMELEKPAAAYNVCSGRAVSIRQVLEWILDEADVEVEVRVDPARVRTEEMQRIVGNRGLLHEHTGWEPNHSIEQTIREVYRWIAGSCVLHDDRSASRESRAE